jgi:hypothetical protein
MVWSKNPLAPIGKIKSGKQNIAKRYTPKNATPIGAKTMFLQLVSAIHHFQRFTNSFNITNDLCSSGGKNVQRRNNEALPTS